MSAIVDKERLRTTLPRLLLCFTHSRHIRYFAVFCATTGAYSGIGLSMAWCKLCCSSLILNITRFYQLLTILALNPKELQGYPSVEQSDKEGASWARIYTRSPTNLSTGKPHAGPKKTTIYCFSGKD
jgi:hypothetical protein